MHNLEKDIEKSARKVFRLFFESKLHLIKRRVLDDKKDLLGVDLRMFYDGNKKISLYMDKSTVNLVKERLAGPDGFSGNDADYVIMNELANMIAGSAIKSDNGEAYFYSPKISDWSNSVNDITLNFSSDLGRIAISIQEQQ
jgi:hypothetical protein